MLDEQILQTEQNNETVTTEKSTGFEPIITDSHRAARVLEENGIVYEGDIELGNIGFCKIEAQQGCLTGSFCIPKLLDVQGSRYRILFFILKEDKTPTSIGGELRQICLGGSPISFQDKASGGLQRCAEVLCHAKHDAHLAASTSRRT